MSEVLEQCVTKVIGLIQVGLREQGLLSLQERRPRGGITAGVNYPMGAVDEMRTEMHA